MAIYYIAKFIIKPLNRSQAGNIAINLLLNILFFSEAELIMYVIIGSVC